MGVGPISGLRNAERRGTGGELCGPASNVGKKAGSRQIMGDCAMTEVRHYRILNKRVAMGMLYWLLLIFDLVFWLQRDFRKFDSMRGLF